MIAGSGPAHEGRIETPGVARTLYSYNLERLPGWSCVGDHIAKVTPPARRERMAELIRAFGLEQCSDARFAQLSLGQKNRANLTRYLVQDFDLLIMDESLANVDETTREKILLKIKRMFPEKGFLYISHNVAEVAKFCRQIIVLRHAAKRPQAVSIAGLDLAPEQALEKSRLERTMLEIVHAA
jgi:ABC-type nitrate/sulfonate/bicarbonate transport system ATPase subunit